MSEFNFKSAICTSREQSERLLGLGLKKETADMHHSYYTRVSFDGSKSHFWKEETGYNEKAIPAWSLHRLIEIADTAYLEEGRRDDDNELWFCMDRCYCWNNHESFYATNLYDSLINCIKWLIKEGYFNKEYLE